MRLRMTDSARVLGLAAAISCIGASDSLAGEIIEISDKARIEKVTEEVQRKIISVTAPNDGRHYRLVDRKTEILKAEHAEVKIVNLEYSPASRTLTATLKLEPTCRVSIFNWVCPAAVGLGRLTAYFERDSAEIAPEIPKGLERVVDVRTAYELRNLGLKREIEAIQDRKESVIEAFKATLAERIEGRVGSETAAVAGKNAGLESFSRLTSTYKQRILALSPGFTAFMKRYATEYPAAAQALNQELVALAGEASEVPLEAIPELALRFTALESRDWQLTSDAAAIADEFERRFRSVHEQYLWSMRGLEGLLSESGLSPADSISEPLSALAKVRSACRTRSDAFASQIRLIGEALKTREKNLIARLADQKSRADIARAQRLESAARFVREIREEAKRAWGSPRTVPGTDLAYLGEDMLRKRDFLIYRDLCSKSNEWNRQGCLTGAPDFERTAQYLDKSLGRLLKSAASKARSWNRTELEPALLRVEQGVAEGRVVEAAREWDQILRSLESRMASEAAAGGEP